MNTTLYEYIMDEQTYMLTEEEVESFLPEIQSKQMVYVAMHDIDLEQIDYII